MTVRPDAVTDRERAAQSRAARPARVPPIGLEAEHWSPRFEAVFRVHAGRVVAYCLRRLGDRAAAEDVAAETFLVAWRRLDAMPADDELPWLLGIARRTISNQRRSDRRRERLLARVVAEEVAGATEPDPPPNASGAIHVALGQLSERDREVLMLTTWDGLDQRRAAAVVGCSEGAFKVRLHRARKRLARALDATSSTPEETS
jgi:RNA polymerase sigma factor (sigma-70 family)